MGLISKKLSGIIIASGLVLILALNIFLIQPITFSLILTSGLILTVIYLNNPFRGILLFVAIRPSIDRFSEELSISIGDRISLSGSSFMGLLLIALSFLLILKYFKNISPKSSLLAWLLYLLAIITSIIFSINKLASVYELIRVLSIFMIFINALILIKTKKEFLQSIWAILISSIIPFVFSIYQAITGTGLGGTADLESRLMGTFSHPNSFASFVIIIITIIIYLLIQKDKIFVIGNKKFLYPALLISIIILLATFSRGALLGFLIFIFILSLFKSPKYILITIVLFFIAFSVSQDFRYRIEDIYNPPADSSVRWRFEQWNKLAKVYIKNPIKGYGAGTEIISYEKEFGFYAGNPYTHNDLLRSALETGIFGLFAFSILWATTAINIFKKFLKNKKQNDKTFLLLIFALIMAEIAFSMSSNIFRGTATQWTLWFLIGLALTIPEKNIPSPKIREGKEGL